MKLELGRIKIEEVELGSENGIEDGKLSIDEDELVQLICEDSRIKSVELTLARPGESTRIIPVKDVIEPRCKVEGGEVFPGFVGENQVMGSGRTLVLENTAVVTTGDIVGYQEGTIEMSGPGAEYTPFSETLNIVIDCEVEDDIEDHRHEEVLRIMGLKAAQHIGRIARGTEPDTIEEYEQPALNEAAGGGDYLPRVGYIYMLQSQGLLHDTYVYSVDAKEILPTIISPTEVMDGAIVSGNCVSACDKNTTYFHQNNPVIEELYREDGRTLNFVGTIITNENVTLDDKERSSDFTARLAEQLDLDAAIVSEEGFGNPDADLIMNCRKLEGRDIKTVLLTDEFAGSDGASQSLADSTPEGDAVVSTGNANEIIRLPAMERVIGQDKFADSMAGGFEGSLKEDGSIEVEIQAIIGATNELGFGYLTAREY
ncbi:glycine/sarcosine/betaine reductase component B subunit [Halarsenatibacter silvermanii]|uniref:Glycine reductase n=1 Tax=Halarsenatibacter silvermanii TaxID=321763 RepID=A0A1G9N2A1_9FIRM|nr:glycine/sarcosine/betaine reductase component B subunit [Halarsenatibacter silvermanii]SDL80640.1 glycine reductase [Halarsenatibacter silvermanii]